MLAAIKNYVLATIVISFLGFGASGYAFAFLFLSGQGASLYQVAILLFLFLLPGVLSYYSAKLLKIVWWYPSLILVGPALVWFLFEITSPNSVPYILLLPISVLLIISLPAGRLGQKNRSSTHA